MTCPLSMIGDKVKNCEEHDYQFWVSTNPIDNCVLVLSLHCTAQSMHQSFLEIIQKKDIEENMGKIFPKS